MLLTDVQGPRFGSCFPKRWFSVFPRFLRYLFQNPGLLTITQGESPPKLRGWDAKKLFN
jgi:hypothetical protein